MLDQLTVAGQATGVSTDQLLDTVSKNSARWQAGGGDVEGLMAHVVELAGEFGPTGLRGAMSETMAEVDTGVLPTVRTLEAQLGDTTGAVERTFEASYTWRDAHLRGEERELVQPIWVRPATCSPASVA